MKKISAHFSFLILPIFVLTILAFGGGLSYAAADPEADPLCDPYASSYDAEFKLWKINIAGTTGNLINSLIQNLFQKTFGIKTSDAVKCESWILNQIVCSEAGAAPAGGFGFTGTEGELCTGTSESICQQMVGNTKTAYDGNNSPLTSLTIKSSLMGINNSLYHSAMYDPIPVNFAYFWKHQAAKVPFAGKALAAETGRQAPILAAGVTIWEDVRNLALGFIAIILMYTGLLIIMRKKVNPQLVVTVQYAIPKIIIGLVLILFSYPIGSAITSISWGMFRGASDIVYTTLCGSGTSINISNMALATIAIAGLKMGWFTSVGLFIVAFAAIILSITFIILYIKAFLIYLKMIFATIISPIDFAVGTVPGSEGKIGDWFKKMAKYGLTIFAMGAIVPVTMVMALKVLIYYATICTPGGYCDVEVAGFGTIMMLIAPVVIIIVGCSMAFGMEKTIDKWIFGGKDSKR